MEWVDASRYRLKHGRHEGETLRMVAREERGLRYLYWLSGQEWIDAELSQALNVYLDNAPIKRELEIVGHLSGRLQYV